MKRVSWLLLASCLVAGVVPAQTGPDTGRVEREEFDGGSRLEVRLPGRLLGYAAPRDGSSVSELLLLVGPAPPDPAPEAGPAAGSSAAPTSAADYHPCRDETSALPVALWRLQLGDDPPLLERVRDDLPADATMLDAVDLDRDGRDEVLLWRPGALLRFPSRDGRGVPDVVLDDENHELRRIDGRGYELDGAGRAWIRVPGIGFHRFYRYDDDSAGFRLVAQIEVKTGAMLTRGAMQVWTSALLSLGPGPDGGPRFASWPEVVDRRRLRTDLIDPAATDEHRRSVECWGRLPQEEHPVERFARTLDGQPVLIVTSMPVGRLNLFGEKLLRIFPVASDRSRGGLRPLFETSTRMNVWQSVFPYLLDLDGDGRDDLVLGYWKGLKDDKVVLDAYRRDAHGGFGPKPQSTGFDVKAADRGMLLYGKDLVGDASADLVVRGGGKLLVYPGTAGTGALVSGKPSHVIPLGEVCEDAGSSVEISIGASDRGMSMSQSGVDSLDSRILDLDGDHRSELIVAQPWSCNSARLHVITLTRKGDIPN